MLKERFTTGGRFGFKVEMPEPRTDLAQYTGLLREFPLYTREQELARFKEFTLYKKGYRNACLRSKEGLEFFIEHYGHEIKKYIRYINSKKISQHSRVKYKALIEKIQRELKKLRDVKKQVKRLDYESSRLKTQKARQRKQYGIKAQLKTGADIIQNSLQNKGLAADREEETFSRIRNYYDLDDIKSRLIQKRYTRYHALKKEISQANLRLVISVAKNYKSRSMSLLDLVQEGNIGLLRAVEGFEYERGCRFSTYAFWWIRQTIYRALTEKQELIRLPHNKIEERTRFRKTRRTLTDRLSREPHLDEISKEQNLEISEVLSLEKIDKRKTLSLDFNFGRYDGTLGDIVEAKGVKELLYRHSEIEEAVNNLPSKMRDIIIMRFGLNGGRACTLDKIGKKLYLTRERVRQIQKQALKRLFNYFTMEMVFKTG